MFFEKKTDESYEDGVNRLKKLIENQTDYTIADVSVNIHGHVIRNSTIDSGYGYLTAGKIINIRPELLIVLDEDESIEDGCKRVENKLSEIGVGIDKESINPARAHIIYDDGIDIEID